MPIVQNYDAEASVVSRVLGMMLDWCDVKVLDIKSIKKFFPAMLTMLVTLTAPVS